ncbi:MAG: metallophosphoesterase [Granulosicoccus sp.]
MLSRTKKECTVLVGLVSFALFTVSPFALALSAGSGSTQSLVDIRLMHDTSVSPPTKGFIEAGSSPQTQIATQTATQKPLLDIDFSNSAGSFYYNDDVFRNTAQPYYANGRYIDGGQCDSDGCLKASFGGKDNRNINDMSGGWTSTFNVQQTSSVSLSLRYRIRQLRDYEPNEYTDALVSLDGVLLGLAGNDYLRRIRGDGNGGSNIDSGWLTATLNLGTLSAGTHTLTVGGYNNRKTARKEYSSVWFDNITMSSSTAGSGDNSSEESILFGVLGDFGIDNDGQAEVSAEMDTWNLDFIITVGDNRYGDLSMDQVIGQYYCGFLTDVDGGPYCPNGTSSTNAFFPSPGNHDYGDGGGVDEYLDYFNLPGTNVLTSGTSGSELYYDFIQGPVHFFSIDSEGPRQAQQRDWLQQGLAASTAPWKVVFFHHPPYSSSSYHGSNARMQLPFAAWGADVVIGGHDHTYERIERDGVVFFVNGLGGRNFYDLGSPVTGSRFRYKADHGAQRITASPTRMKFEFVTRTGNVVDSRTIQR